MFAVVSVSGVANCGHLRDACSTAQLGRIILIWFIKSVGDDVDWIDLAQGKLSACCE
jgi:hypothetical protein